MKKLIIILLFIVILIPLLVIIFRDLIISWIAFYPDKEVDYIPDKDYISEKRIETEDGILIHTYFFRHARGSSHAEEGISQAKAGRKVVLYFHGNAGNNSHRIGEGENLYRLGYDVLLVSYRGYGKSDGRVSEKGIYRDARAALEFILSAGYEMEQVYILGRSIGSTAAVEVSRNRQIGGLILVTPLSNAADMIGHYGLPFARLLAKGRFDNMSKINSIRTKLLVIHGTEDRIVPYDLGKKLYDHFTGTGEFITLEGADHNNISIIGYDDYRSSVSRFIGK